MKKLIPFKIILFILLCECCVDPFNTSLSENKTLVVDGLVTDQRGPQTISLSYSSNIGVGDFTRELISGALVTIVDNIGGQVQLNEVSAGIYQTDSTYIAQQGKSYFVRISLDDQIYESDLETLLPVGELDSIFFKLNATSQNNRFEVYANSSKPAQSTGLMRWRSSFIYQIFTQPFLAPEPIACAIPCTCCICWVSGQANEIVVSDGSNFNNNKSQNNLVSIIPIGDEQFEFKYFLKVDQLSLSANAYNFWKLVISQQTGTTSLFQPASARIQGNIHSVTNPREQVLGLFEVSSVSSKSIFIQRSDIPSNLQPSIPKNIGDCRNQGTTIRPSFW